MRTSLIVVALFAYLVQAMIPVGFMPGGAAGASGIVSLCPSGPLYHLAPKAASDSPALSQELHAHHHHHAHHSPIDMGEEALASEHDGHAEHLDRAHWNSDCVFGSLSGVAEYDLPVFHASQLFVVARNVFSFYVHHARSNRLVLKPPARAPPIFLV